MVKIVAFDIFGTCFGFSNVVDALEQQFGSEIKQAGTTPAHVFMAWFYAVQRDFTYLSAMGEYTPMPKVWAATLPRALAIALNPAIDYPSMSLTSSFPSDKLAKVVEEVKNLPARPGLANAFDTLWEAGYEIYAVSNGAKEGTKRLLSKVESNHKKAIFTDGSYDKYIISCDDVQNAKPFLDIYRQTLKQAGADVSSDTCWFVAAHTWDLAAARKAGFKTAFVTFEEVVTCEEIYGKPDIVEDGLAKLAKAIVGRI